MIKDAVKASLVAVALMGGAYAPSFAFTTAEPEDDSSYSGSEVVDPTDYGPANKSVYSPSSQSVHKATPSKSSSSAAPGAQWETVNQLQQLQDEVQGLRGIVEKQAYEIEQMRKQQRDRYIDLDSRITRLQGGAATVSSSSQNVPGSDSRQEESRGADIKPADAHASTQQVVPESEKAAYAAAFDNVKAKQYPQAITQLNALLASSPNGQYAPNCYYWLGELYMVGSPPDYDRSQANFQALLKNYPENAKASDALYKLGKLSDLKGDKARAKVYLERVVKDFPESQAAVLAKDYLKRIGSR